MNTWTPLWSKIVDSSLWGEPDHVCKVFLTMLALKDSDHVCRLNNYSLSLRSRKSEAEVLDALKILSSPDTRRTDGQEHDGRRVKLVEDGWLILNGEHYRSMVSREMTRQRNVRAQRAFRDRKNQIKSKPLKGETENVKRWQDGLQADPHP